MPIAKTKTLLEDKKPELQRKEVLPAPKPIAVDTKYEPRTNLLQYVSGARWIVNYYKQLKTSEEASEAFDADRPIPYQQYTKIENFEIRVSQPLTQSIDETNMVTTVTGQGLVYPSIVPDNGDTFLADVGDGRTGLFNIQNVIQKSYLKDTVYEIEYALMRWVDHNILKELDSKVVQTFHYERAYADYGANPKLDSKQHGLFKKLTQWQSRIGRFYFDNFYSHEYDTFLVPVPGMVVYDPYIVEFIRRLWTTEDIPELRYLKVYNRDSSNNILIKTIWDSILTNDLYSLANVKTKFGVIPRRLFTTGLSGLAGITYSRLQYIYHPITVKDPLLGKYEIPNVGKLDFSKTTYDDFPSGRMLTLELQRLPGLGFVHPDLQQHLPIPDAKKFGTYDTYVLSPAFYQRDKANMSKIERMLMASLEEDTVDAEELLPILEKCIDWPDLERFYYIPLLVALCRTALGDLSQ